MVDERANEQRDHTTLQNEKSFRMSKSDLTARPLYHWQRPARTLTEMQSHV